MLDVHDDVAQAEEVLRVQQHAIRLVALTPRGSYLAAGPLQTN